MLLFFLSVCCLITTRIHAESKISNILLLGGNGLLGSATVKKLLLFESTKYKITVLNRGNWYWDTDVTVKPYVKHIRCDRGDGFRESCPRLGDGTMYDAVVDFSGYHPLDVEDMLIVLRGRFKRYIYISTESVYEVCKHKNHSGYSKENDAVRPDDENLRKEYNSKDEYGHYKLVSEEVLHKYHRDLGYDYIVLRLPDVIGPRDNTIRFWKYYLWVKLHRMIGSLHIPLYVREKPLSFVYSYDVGNLIASLVDPNFNRSGVFNQAYNLAFKENITLKRFFSILGNFNNDSLIKFDEANSAQLTSGFPSVTRGPVDISLAIKQLDWSPTNIVLALNETCKFYENAEQNHNYHFNLKRALDRLGVRREIYAAYRHGKEKSVVHEKEEL